MNTRKDPGTLAAKLAAAKTKKETRVENALAEYEADRGAVLATALARQDAINQLIHELEVEHTQYDVIVDKAAR